ncbi:MAG: hypothetical protein ABI778_02005 [Ignavibacteriota bacterium]
MTTPKNRFVLQALALIMFFVLLSPLSSFSQTVDPEALKGKVDGLDERTSTLESTVAGMAKMKLSGYVQPQWVWNQIDSNGNPGVTRSFFQIRRGRVKFTHKSGDLGAVVYPDITEAGVVIKEVYATWDFMHDRGLTSMQVAMGAMNRPFGYEIAYSSSAREVVERSIAENRLFNGERDLGIQLAYTPGFGDFRPILEFGLFNGSDNFAMGPANDVNGGTFAFAASAIQGANANITASGADSLFIASKVNTKIASLSSFTTGGGWKQNQKELMGHIRLPFLLSDELSFDLGGSWSVGGITPPSDVEATYGSGGVLKLAGSTSGAPHAFNAKTGWEPSGLFLSNRTIFGADAQFYLSVLPFGGSIIKAEMYTGNVPFYGSPALVSSADAATFGDPTPILVKKSVMGFYAMLVQNITDMFQLAIRYDTYDPNTNVTGTDFATTASPSGPTINGAGYLKANSGFGGDLKVNTFTIGINAFVQGSLRFMFDYDFISQELISKNVGSSSAPVIVTAAAANAPSPNRFTMRMQYKF